MAIATTRKKKKVIVRRAKGGAEPKWDDWQKLTPQDFGRHITTSLDYYRLDCKSSDYKRYVIEYCNSNEYWSKFSKQLNKLADGRFNSVVGGLCRQATLGRPETHPEYNKYWESLAGTMGTPKPLSESIDKFLKELKEQSQTIVDEEKAQKKKEEKEGTKYVPTIQERIHQQAVVMDEKVADWLDTWYDDVLAFNPKGFDFKKHFYEMGVTQAHARKLKSYYEPELNELLDVITPPKLPKDATDQEKDWADQLKEAYSIFKKPDLKKKIQAIQGYIGALDVVIDTAKAKRKPRKVVPKSKEKLIAKLKYAVNNDKFHLASINPTEIIGCNELWVFNVKTRKLGKYVASVIDPLGAEREGSGLSVKGTTITGFNEETSVQKTLRKPEEKLKEFKDAGKRKLNTFLDEINAVDIKLNGRINLDTILLKAIR